MKDTFVVLAGLLMRGLPDFQVQTDMMTHVHVLDPSGKLVARLVPAPTEFVRVSTEGFPGWDSSPAAEAWAVTLTVPTVDGFKSYVVIRATRADAIDHVLRHMRAHHA